MLTGLYYVEELCRRSGLAIALSNRDEETLEPLLSFVARYISNPRYARLLIQVSDSLLDLYSSVIGHSDAIDELFLKLCKHVKGEVTFQRQVMKCLGALDGIISVATMPKPHSQGQQPHAGLAMDVAP
jgi:U3 small nucleolar RNA-associated protein 15